MPTVVSANIKDNPDLSPAQVEHDTKVVAKLGGLIGWQEIGEKADHAAVGKACPPKAWDQEHKTLAVPISTKKRYWTVVDRGRVKTHNGLAGVSPTRYVTWVVLQDRKKKKFALVNTHYVSGAWNSKPKKQKKWRQDQWRKHWKKQQEVIADLLSADISVLGTGDFNRVKVAKFFPQQVWLVGGSSGIDKLYYINAEHGVRFRKTKKAGKYQGKVYTDHKPCYAEVTIT